PAELTVIDRHPDLLTRRREREHPVARREIRDRRGALGGDLAEDLVGALEVRRQLAREPAPEPGALERLLVADEREPRGPAHAIVDVLARPRADRLARLEEVRHHEPAAGREDAEHLGVAP